MDETLRELVRLRAGNRCEYCRIRQEHVPLTKLQVEHIIARQHSGDDDLSNLALACDRCNLHKGPNLTSIDPATGEIVPLFHPRRDHWDEHFRWDGSEIVGLTPKGRTTIRLLQLNDSRRLRLRTTLRRLGQFD